MAAFENFDLLDEEIRELLLNCKTRKPTYFEPCTQNNIVDCLIGLQEEMFALNHKYIFNPYTDIEKSVLTSTAVVALVNAAWNLLQHYKQVASNSQNTNDRIHALQQNNSFLNKTVDRLKDNVAALNSELKQCRAISEQISEKACAGKSELQLCKADIKRLSKQKLAADHQAQTELKRLRRDYEVLQDKFRGQSGVYTSKNEAVNTSIEQYRAREKKYKETINKLQVANRELIHEVLGLKEDLLHTSCDDQLSDIENLNH